MCLLAISVSFLEKCLFQYLALLFCNGFHILKLFISIYLAVPGLSCTHRILVLACGSRSLMKDRTQASRTGSMESQPLDYWLSPFCSSINWVAYLAVLVSKCSLYFLDIYQAYDLQTLSPILWVVSSYFDNAFMHKIFKFCESSLPIFHFAIHAFSVKSKNSLPNPIP